jgi:hypothetical protein
MQTANNIIHAHIKKNPFCVPDGYFESLPQQIGHKMSAVSARNVLGTHSVSSFRKVIRPQLALAASFALMITLGYGLVRLITPHRVENESSYVEHISLFQTYALLQSVEREESLDSESIITFLTDQGISLYAIASIDY